MKQAAPKRNCSSEEGDRPGFFTAPWRLFERLRLMQVTLQ
jgi:hypothetical protein